MALLLYQLIFFKATNAINIYYDAAQQTLRVPPPRRLQLFSRKKPQIHTQKLKPAVQHILKHAKVLRIAPISR